MPTKLTLLASFLAPLALAGGPALAQDYPSDNPVAHQVDAIPPDAGAPPLAVTLGSDGDELAMADAEIDHRIDLRVGDGKLTGQEADTVRADLDAIRADAAQVVTENGRLTGRDRAEFSERLSDLKDEVEDLADNPDIVPS
ncbi:hypothetical protein QO010_001972 [Caulobacter ginsengisoli]|uniref:Uncharacterized protein n=1 Tax=Caulobacter ginsengisoli TaxID=400775 RepID=A0ABU0IS63_9CAUL|nr:hypothetical protein [Caulobacter ginsengisoli]MDQ0464191.1 hypothetical protein [Caulobacter ginsengisoli]